MTTANNKISQISFVWEQISKVVFILLTCMIGMIAWQGKEILAEIHDHEKRISVIEGNRYTVNDARADNMQILDRIADLRSWIESNFPPSYLLDDVRALEQNQIELRKNQEAIQKLMSEQGQIINSELSKIREQIAKP